jgi:hypothetical protein
MRDGLAQGLRALDRALRRVGAPYMIIGGVAVVARGVARLTDDVDATVWGGGVDLAVLLKTLGKVGITPRIEGAVEFARQHQVLLLRHEPSSTDMEVSLAWLPFEKEALRAANRLELAGADVPVARAEDLIIYKAVAWRDRDREMRRPAQAARSGRRPRAGPANPGRVRRSAGPARPPARVRAAR